MAETSRRRGMHPLLAFFLGFLLALIIIIGSVAGVIIFALNFKLDKIGANKDSDGNYIFINADPNAGGVGTILDLIGKVSEMSKGYSTLTVGEIEELLPVMGSLTEKLETELNKFLTLEDGELQEVKLGGLSEFVTGLADRINVAKLIGTTTDDAILVYMSYGVHGLYEKDGEWYAKYNDGENEYVCTLEFGENGKIDGVYYMDGDEKVYTPYLTLENVKERVGGVCEELTIGEIVPISGGDRILGSIKNSTVNTISEDINNLCMQQIFSDEVYARENAENGNFPEAEIYLAVTGETPEIAANFENENVIYYLNDGGNYVLAGNNGKLTSAQFDEYVNDSGNPRTLYTLGAGKILYDPSYLYYDMDEDGDIKMVNYGTANAGRAPAPLSGEEIYTYGAASPLWKLLLYVEDGADDKIEQAFTFNNVGNMISNVSKNTQGTPMRELDAAGILTFDNKDDLEVKIKHKDKNGNEIVEPLGDIPLEEVIGIAVAYFKVIESLP